MISVLVRNWWAFVARGVFAVLFGLIALLLPGVTMLSLVLVFAAYAIADGLFAIVSAVRSAKAGERAWPLAFEGIAGVLAGVIAVSWPALTVVVFVAIVATWAIVTGGLLFSASLKMTSGHGRGWLILAAAASILYGILLVIAPMAGAVVLTWWIGAYALVFGVAMLAFAIRLRAKFKGSGVSRVLEHVDQAMKHA